MADASDTIKEFLVSIFYAEDEASKRKAVDGIAAVGVRFAQFATAIEAQAAAVVAGIAKIASGMEALYFASRRAGAGVEGIQAFGYAISQMGGTVDGARNAVESLGRFLRVNPGGQNFLRNLGVTATDTTEQLEQLGGILRGMPYYRANVIGQFLGIDERTLMGMIQGVDKFGADYRTMLRAAGLDSQKTAADSHAFMVELRGLGAAFDILGQKVEATLAREIGGDIRSLRDLIVSNFGRITQIIVVFSRAIIWMADGLARFLGSVAAMGQTVWDWFSRLGAQSKLFIETLGALFVAWRVLGASFLATPFGVVMAGFGALFLLLDDFMAFQRGGKHLLDWEHLAPQIQKLFGGVWDAIKPFKDGLDSITSIFGQWQGAAEAFLVYMGLRFVPRLVGMLGSVAAAALGMGGKGAVAGAASGGGLLGWISRGLGLGTFLYEMWPSATNGGRSSTDPSKSAEREELDRLHPDRPQGTPAPAGAAGASGGWGGNIAHWVHTHLFTDTSARQKEAMDYFVGQNWTREQSAGIVANLSAESSLNPNEVGDGGLAHGLAQWHPDRQAAIEAQFHKKLADMTFAEQLAAVDWELRQGGERGAGTALQGTTTAGAAGDIVSRRFERPQYTEAEATKRAALAEKLASLYPTSGAAAPGAAQPDYRAFVENLRQGIPNLDTAAANVNGMQAASLGPSPVLMARGENGATDRSVTLHQTTEIKVMGGDATATGRTVGREQDRVNADLMRTAQNVYR